MYAESTSDSFELSLLIRFATTVVAVFQQCSAVRPHNSGLRSLQFLSDPTAFDHSHLSEGYSPSYLRSTGCTKGENPLIDENAFDIRKYVNSYIVVTVQAVIRLEIKGTIDCYLDAGVRHVPMNTSAMLAGAKLQEWSSVLDGLNTIGPHRRIATLPWLVGEGACSDEPKSFVGWSITS